MNHDQKVAKCNQAIAALNELYLTVWMDPTLGDAINEASDRVTRIKSLLQLRHTADERRRRENLGT